MVAAALLGSAPSAKADIFDVNGTTAGFGITADASYNWLGASLWSDGALAANDAGTAATVTWQGTSAVSEQAYFIGAGAGLNYTVRLGTTGASNVFIQNLALNVNAGGAAALTGAAGNLTIGNVGDTGALTLRAANSIGAQAGGTLTINNGVNLNTFAMSFRGGSVVINGVVSGTGASKITYGTGTFGLTSGTLTLANTANTFAGRTNADFVPANYTLAVTRLANGGQSSSLGTSSANIGINGGTLRFIGVGAQSTNLGLNIASGGAIVEASGATTSDTISFSGAPTYSAGNQAGTITLRGTNTGANTMAFNYGNNGSGVNTLTKSGDGTWVISGTNSYTGGTTISGGRLVAANVAALGAAGQTVNLSGTGGFGTLDLATDTSANAYVLNASSVAGVGGTVLVNRATLGAAITHTMGASTFGNAKVNVQAGGNVTSGTPVLEIPSITLSAGAAGDGATTLIPTTAAIRVTGAITRTGASANSLVLDGTNTANLISGAISGPQTLTKSNTGTWELAGANTYTGNTVVTGGTLRLMNNLAIQNSAFDTSGAGTLDVSTLTMPTFGGLIGDAATGKNLVLPPAVTALTLNPTVAATTNNYAKDISGGAAGLTLTKTGAGTQVLSGSSNHSGLTSVNAGMLTIGNGLALGSTVEGTTVASGASLTLANGVTVTGETILIAGTGSNFNGSLQAAASASAEWAGTVRINNATGRLGSGIGGSLRVSGAIVSNPGFNDLNIGAGTGGTGEVILSAAAGQNTYTGLTTITRGTLKLGADNTLPTTTTLDVDNANAGESAVFDLGGFNQTIAKLQRSNAGGGAGGAIITNSGSTDKTLTINQADTTDFNGVIQDGATARTSVIKSGVGILTLSGVNTFTGGTSVTGGTLKVGSATALGGATGATTVSAGASLDLNGVTMTAANSLTLNGTGIADGGAFANSSAATATYAGTLSLSSDSSIVASGGDIILSSTGDITGSGFGLTVSGPKNVSIAANLSTGSGNLVKSGAGTLTLSSAQSYAGSTTVSNGTLLVNAALASSATTVASGATLGGTGTLANAVTINAGGTLSPATATTTGTLTIGSLTLDAGSLLAFEFGTPSDLVAVTTPSGLTINGGALSLYAAGGIAPLTDIGTYTLFTYGTAYAGDRNNLSVSNSQAGKTYAISDTGSALQLVIGTATSSDWSGTLGNGLWTSDGAGGNWNGATAPNSLGAVVNFGPTPSALTTVTLNGAKTVGGIIFNNANGYVIGTTTDAISLDNGIAAGAISVTVGSHTINAPVVLNGPANITPAATTALIFGGAISGAGKALTFSGAGTVTLSAANTFGSAALSAGTLNLGNDGALGSGLVTISGGTLDAVGGARALSVNNLVNLTGDFAFTGTNDLNFGTGAVSIPLSRTLTVTAGTLAFGGSATGAGFTKAGAGTLALTGNTSFTGAITLAANGGTLVLSGNNSARPAGTQGLTTVNSGATLQLQANSGNTSGGVSTALSSEQTAAQPLLLNNGSTLQLRADSAVTFAGANNLGGGAIIAIDVGRLSSAGSNNTLTLAPAGFAVSTTTLNVTGADGYTLRLPAITAPTTNTATYNPTTANLSIGNYTATAAATLALSGTSSGNLITGVISGAAIVTKAGASTWDLQGANTYTGATNISAGTLTFSGNRTANFGAAITVGNVATNAATLNVQGNLPLATQRLNVGSAAGATGTVNHTSGTVSFTGGDAVLIGNTSAGATGIYNLNGGSLALNFAAASTTRGVMVGANSGAAGNLINATFNLTEGSLNNPNGALIVVRGENTASYQSSAYNQTGGTSSNGTLTIGGNGASGANSVATFNVTGGTFTTSSFPNLSAGNIVTSTITIGGTADVTLPAFPTARGTGSTATLYFNGGTLKPLTTSPTYLGGLTNAFIQAGGAKFDTNNFDITVSQALLADANSTGGGLTKAGNGALTLTGANTFTGGLLIEAGTLVLGNATALNPTAGSENAAAFGASSTGTLRLNGSSIVVSNLNSDATPGTPAVENASATNVTLTVGNAANLSGTFAGVLRNGTGAGILGLTKVGNGTLTLTGANTYSGTTTVTTGILRAGAANAFSPNSAFNLANATGVSLDLAGYSQTLNSVDGGGTTGGNISLGSSGVLTVGSNSSFNGTISGSGTSGLTKTGASVFTLGATSTFTGSANITVNQGTLVLNGTTGTNISANVAAAATLRGTGNFGGSLTVADGGVIQAGNNGVGTLTINQLTFAGASSLTFASSGSNPSNLLTATSLTTTGPQSIFLNVTGVPVGGWASGTYELINYGSIGGTGTDAFRLGTIAGTAARIIPALVHTPGKVSLNITSNIVRWTGTAGSEWSTTATGNWELHPAGTVTNFLQGDALLFDDNATGTTTVTTDSAPSFIRPSAVTFNNSLTDYRLEGDGYMDPSFQQSVGLIKNGTKTLTISALNIYTGTTVINDGKIVMSGAGLLGDESPLVMAGGQLDLGGGAQAMGAVSITHAANMGATIEDGSLTALSFVVSNTTGNAIVDANLGGDANTTFLKTGAGTVTLSQANSFDGGTTVGGGALVLSGRGTLSAAGALTLSGGSLDLGNSSQTVGAVSITGAATSGHTILNGGLTGTSYEASNANGDAVVSANLLANINAVGFTKTGAGTVTLSGANTFTGTVTINGGVLSANSIADAVSSSIGLSLAADTALWFGANGGTLRFTGLSGTTRRSITFTGPATFDIATGASLTLGTVTAVPVSTDGAWSGAGSITKSGNGTLTIRNTSPVANSNRFTVDGVRGGNFIMQAGTLNITPGQYFTIGESGTVASSFTQTGGTVNYTPSNTAAGNDVYVGNATVAGQLIVTGGTFNVTPAALQIRVGQATAGTLSVGGGGGSATVDSPTVSLGVGAGNGVFNLYANGVLITSALKDGPGGGNSTVNFDGGTLRAKSASGALFMPAGFNTAAITSNGLTTDTNSFDVTIGQALGGAGALTKIGNGVLTLSGANSYAGGTLISTGTLALGHASNTLADAGTVTVNGGTLGLGANSDTVGSVILSSGSITGTTGVLTSSASYDLRNGDVSAILGGTVGLDKTTAGTVTLSAVNQYTGATTITGGTLALAGSGSISSSTSITVNGAGAKLIASVNSSVLPPVTLTQGTVTGNGSFTAVNVGSGGVVSNNDGVGGAALTISTLTLAAGSSINVHASDPATPALVLGLLTNNGAANQVTLSANRTGGWANDTVYQLVSYASFSGNTSFNLIVNDRSARQTATWLNDENTQFITLSLTGDRPYWVGENNTKWNTTEAGNWRLASDNSVTDFRVTDEVLFDNRASGAGPVDVDIDLADVTPFSTTFDSTKDYVLGSSGAFGIASGSLTKRGTGSLTINNANTYAGPTTVTGGSLILNGSLDSTAIAIGGTATFSQASSSVIGGTASITTSGALTLAGANTFTGGFTLNAGMTNIGSSTALGNGPLTINGGTIDNTSGSPLVFTNSAVQAWNGNFVFTGSSELSLGTGPITLGSNCVVTVASSTLTFGGPISGSGFNLSKTGNGTLVINGAGTYSGATSVNGGRLSLQGASASSSFSVASAAVLELNAVVDRDYASTSISGAGTLSKTGSGSVVWGVAAANFSLGSGALLDVREGTFTAGSGGNEVWTNNLSDLNVQSGALFNAADAAVRVNRLTGAGVIRAGSASLAIGVDNGSSTFDGVIENVAATTGNLIKAGTGTIALTGVNTYTGTTTVSGGTLTLSGNRTGTIGSITVGNTAGQDATLNITAGTINLGAGEMTVGNATITAMTGTVNQTGGQVIFTAGAGNQLLIGRQTGVANRGVYNLSGGSLTIGLSSNGGRGIILGVNTGTSGGTFNLSGTGVLNMTLASGGTGDANLSIGRFDSTADNTTNAFNQTGGTANVGVLAIAGGSTGVSSTLSLTGGTFLANVFGRLAQGTNSTAVINIGGTADVTLPAFPTARGTGSTATLNFDGGTLKPLASSAAYIGGLNNAFIKAAGAKFDTNAFDITVSQALLADTVSTGGGLTKAGNGSLTLSGTNTYTGVTTVNGGTLRVASLGTTGNSSVGSSDRAVAANLALNGPVRLEYAGTGETTSRSFTVSGSGVTLASSGTTGALDFTSATNVAFADAGASTRELRLAGTNTGDNTFAASAAGTPAAADRFSRIVKNEVGKWIVAGSGTTFADNLQVEVNAGLLAFAGTRTGASVTVNNGGTLGGSATLGAVTVNNGGALSPGSSPGVLTSSTLSLAGGSIINWQVSDALGAAGIGYDQLAVTGNLDLRGASAANKIVIKISSITALDANGDPLYFGAPNGVSSIRTFQFGQVGGVLLNNGENISDVFAFDVDGFTYTGGAASNAGLWSISWNAGAITLTAVPEPSTYGIGLGALALAAAALRRRRRPAPQA